MSDALRMQQLPPLADATLVLALTGWMDGGDVSTGTVRRLVDLLEARPAAEYRLLGAAPTRRRRGLQPSRSRKMRTIGM